jgi:hypothetical protein
MWPAPVSLTKHPAAECWRCSGAGPCLRRPGYKVPAPRRCEPCHLMRLGTCTDRPAGALPAGPREATRWRWCPGPRRGRARWPMISSGGRSRSGRVCATVRSRPMMTASGRPCPMTSPITNATRSPGQRHDVIPVTADPRARPGRQIPGGRASCGCGGGSDLAGCRRSPASLARSRPPSRQCNVLDLSGARTRPWRDIAQVGKPATAGRQVTSQPPGVTDWPWPATAKSSRSTAPRRR